MLFCVVLCCFVNIPIFLGFFLTLIFILVLPDLRNLSLYYHEFEEGDLLLLMSDGVHDNLDPEVLLLLLLLFIIIIIYIVLKEI